MDSTKVFVDNVDTFLSRIPTIILTTIVLAAAIFILIALLNQKFGTMLATAGTVLLSLSFVFALTAQEFLSSCIFLFVEHPYDRDDTSKMVQVPNSVLKTLWVENVSRSLAMQDVILSMPTSTRPWTTLKPSATSTRTSPSTCLTSRRSTEIRFALRHKTNFANEPLRRQRHNKFIFELIAKCKKVPIYPPNIGDSDLGTSGQPSYSVVISGHEAQKRWAMAQKDKADAKFHKPAPDSASAAGSEEGASAADRASADTVFEIQDSLRRQTTTGKRKPGAACLPYRARYERKESGIVAGLSVVVRQILATGCFGQYDNLWCRRNCQYSNDAATTGKKQPKS
ncbi:hypothetical protein V1506DRAFT_563137 [Lipomyces tetrasporus]